MVAIRAAIAMTLAACGSSKSTSGGDGPSTTSSTTPHVESTVLGTEYDFDDTFQFQSFDPTIPPTGNWKTLTPYEEHSGLSRGERIRVLHSWGGGRLGRGVRLCRGGGVYVEAGAR